MHITNTLFARNTGAGGEAIGIATSGQATIVNSTIATPTVAALSAIHVVIGDIFITNTLIASHTTGVLQQPFGGGSVSMNTMFFPGVDTPGFNTAAPVNVITGASPFVDPAHDDYHLAAGNAAINSGIDAGAEVDYDGDPRPQLGKVDIGYDELMPRKVFLAAVQK